jgi:hypothetical protein
LIVDAHVLDYANPLEGLLAQLDELRGFARTVPPLIQADREARWLRLSEEAPRYEGEETIEAYSRESGSDTGYGFAPFGRTVLAATTVLGWEVFRDYLALRLAAIESGRRWGRRTARDQREEELWSMPLDRLKKAFAAVGIRIGQLKGWETLGEIQLTRNAIVHNHGRYTREYLHHSKARYPTDEDLAGWNPMKSMSRSERINWLTDRVAIPLNFVYVDAALHALADFALLVVPNSEPTTGER